MSITSRGAVTADAAHRSRRIRDPRTFWRLALAVVAPLPWIALAVSSMITPDSVRDSDQQSYAAISAHTGQAAAAGSIGVLFLLGLFPAVVAVLWACRRHAPLLTAWVGGITLLGAAAGLLVPIATFNDYVSAKNGLDERTVLALNKALSEQPHVVVALTLFLLGVILGGRILLGVLLWRSGVAPRWMAAALIIAAPLDVLGPSGLLIRNDNAWISYLLTAIGFAAASRALLRTTNDDFDLPPAAPQRRSAAAIELEEHA